MANDVREDILKSAAAVKERAKKREPNDAEKQVYTQLGAGTLGAIEGYMTGGLPGALVSGARSSTLAGKMHRDLLAKQKAKQKPTQQY